MSLSRFETLDLFADLPRLDRPVAVRSRGAAAGRAVHRPRRCDERTRSLFDSHPAIEALHRVCAGDWRGARPLLVAARPGSTTRHAWAVWRWYRQWEEQASQMFVWEARAHRLQRSFPVVTRRLRESLYGADAAIDALARRCGEDAQRMGLEPARFWAWGGAALAQRALQALGWSVDVSWGVQCARLQAAWTVSRGAPQT